MNTDYAIQVLTEQRRQDFAAEAANDRLARLATADRTPWWQRLVSVLRPEPIGRLAGQHRVAH